MIMSQSDTGVLTGWHKAAAGAEMIAALATRLGYNVTSGGSRPERDFT